MTVLHLSLAFSKKVTSCWQMKSDLAYFDRESQPDNTDVYMYVGRLTGMANIRLSAYIHHALTESGAMSRGHPRGRLRCPGKLQYPGLKYAGSRPSVCIESGAPPASRALPVRLMNI